MNRKLRWTKALVATLVGIASLVPTVVADPCNGVQFGTHTVNAHGEETFYECFWQGEWSRVALIGDGDTDLDLYVYDPFGNLVGCDTDYTDWCEVTWFARVGGTYRIVVLNRGSVYNEFTIQAD
jgi:hypothetical protein